MCPGPSSDSVKFLPQPKGFSHPVSICLFFQNTSPRPPFVRILKTSSLVLAPCSATWRVLDEESHGVKSSVLVFFF